MAKFINWKSNWFNGNYQLFVDGIQKGAINFEIWKSDAHIRFEDQDYLFTNVGFWNSATNVINRKTNEVVAIITYDSWKSKATINLKSGEQYEWEPTDFWRKQWSVSNFKNEKILYHSSNNAGKITSDTDNDLLIVAGLFIKAITTKGRR